MDLDALLYHYLGTDDPATADAATLAAATDRIAIDLGVEREAGRRFALWALMAVLGRAPDSETTFKGATERRAAHDFARLLRRGEALDDAG
ncbi:hypothetical protein [Sphingomonas solaris]|uniref:Uncharacterized protein n=1 Tax=Alterirhizorhabdus solaris TaxID=2529389 RepID=A0A558RCM1_9SPHN|nr:hypothetical protein [Sphingomonas solaris]TVV77227.1 hypothetical protein FOY91_01430 [Sphingomonas solaris]